MVQGPLGDLESLSGSSPGKNSFHNNTKMLLAFFTHISHECMMEFSRRISVILQQIECRADKESSFLLLSQKLKRLAKRVSLFSLNILVLKILPTLSVKIC